MDYGKEYLTKVTALLSVQFLEDDPTRLWLATNVADCEPFDDIVLYKQSSSGKVTAYMITVFYNHNKKVRHEEILTNKENMFLARFSKNFEKLSNSIHQGNLHKESTIHHSLHEAHEIKFVVFGNATTPKSDLFQQSFQQLKLPLQIRVSYGNAKYLTEAVQTSESKLLFLFFHLTDEQTMEEEISNAVRLCLHESISFPSDLVEKYIRFIQKWSDGSMGGQYVLNRNQIVDVLMDIIFDSYMERSFYQKEFSNDLEIYKIYKWIFISENKRVIIIDMNSDNTSTSNDIIYKFLWRYFHEKIDHLVKKEAYISDWEKPFSTEDQKLFYSGEPKLAEQMLKIIGNEGKITVSSIYRVLYKTRQIPIVLVVRSQQEYLSISNILCKTNFIYKVIILNMSGEKINSRFFVKKTFADLNHLNQNELELLLDCVINFQGKCIKVRNITFINKKLLEMIDVKSIIHILTGGFQIGNVLNKVPDTFLVRKLTKTMFVCDINKLFEILQKCEDICVILCENVETFSTCLQNLHIEVPKSYIVDYNDIINQLNIPRGCRIITATRDCPKFPLSLSDKNIHYFELNSDENSLQHIRSSGTSEMLKSSCVESDEVQLDFPILKPGKITIIGGCSGIGKTTTLNKMGQNVPGDMWTVQIKLRRYTTYYDSPEFMSQNAFERLIHINKQILEYHGCANTLNIDIFELFLKSNSVVLLIDGFDQISPMHKEKVTKMLHSFKSEQLRIWLTTRPVLQMYLEREFTTSTITLPTFTTNEQMQFLKTYFMNAVTLEQRQKLVMFSDLLLNSVNTTLCYYEHSLTGIPLHIETLAILYKPMVESFLSGVELQTFSPENIRDFCKKLISVKLEILNKRYGEPIRILNQVYIEEDQKLLAIHLLFNDLSTDVHINSLTTALKLEMLQKDGIVETNAVTTQLSFVDQLLAEYFVAVWLHENPNHIKANQVKSRKFGFINELLEIRRQDTQ